MSTNRFSQEVLALGDRYAKAKYLLDKLAENNSFTEAYNNNQFFFWILDGSGEALKIHINATHLWTRKRFNSLMRQIFSSWNDKLDMIYGTETHIKVVYTEPQLSIKVTYSYAPSDVPPEYLKDGCTLTRTEREAYSVFSITCPAKGAQ